MIDMATLQGRMKKLKDPICKYRVLRPIWYNGATVNYPDTVELQRSIGMNLTYSGRVEPCSEEQLDDIEPAPAFWNTPRGIVRR